MTMPAVQKYLTKYGPMFVLPHDTYIGRAMEVYGEYCEGEAMLFQQIVKPGMTVLDIGANIGAHTLPLSHFAGPEGRVLAFEPQPVVFEVLVANGKANNLSNAMLYNAALGAEVGIAKVPNVDFAYPGNYGGVAIGDGLLEVPLTTVDSFNLAACHFMKIDVEGYEIDVLKGAEQTIRRCQPVLYVENDREEKSASLIWCLLDLEYDLYWHLVPMFRQENFNSEIDNLWPGVVSCNMLCVPRSHGTRVEGFAPVLDANDRPAEFRR